MYHCSGKRFRILQKLARSVLGRQLRQTLQGTLHVHHRVVPQQAAFVLGVPVSHIARLGVLCWLVRTIGTAAAWQKIRFWVMPRGRFLNDESCRADQLRHSIMM